MKRDINKEMADSKKAAVVILVIALLFGLMSIVLYFKKDSWQIFPRMDIAWTGFSVVAFLLLGLGIYLFVLSRRKQEWIDQTDEMEMVIAGQAFMVGYCIQSVLLFLGFFLLLSMGYLNRVSGFSIMGILFISGLVSMIYYVYLKTHGLND